MMGDTELKHQSHTNYLLMNGIRPTSKLMTKLKLWPLNASTSELIVHYCYLIAFKYTERPQLHNQNVA
jgi:hypothetical protein